MIFIVFYYVSLILIDFQRIFIDFQWRSMSFMAGLMGHCLQNALVGQ